jgi:hypothetical protein
MKFPFDIPDKPMTAMEWSVYSHKLAYENARKLLPAKKRWNFAHEAVTIPTYHSLNGKMVITFASKRTYPGNNGKITCTTKDGFLTGNVVLYAGMPASVANFLAYHEMCHALQIAKRGMIWAISNFNKYSFTVPNWGLKDLEWIAARYMQNPSEREAYEYMNNAFTYPPLVIER